MKNDTFHVRRPRRGVLVTADIESKGIEVQALLKAEDAIALAIELILCVRARHKSCEATNHAKSKSPHSTPNTVMGDSGAAQDTSLAGFAERPRPLREGARSDMRLND